MMRGPTADRTSVCCVAAGAVALYLTSALPGMAMTTLVLLCVGSYGLARATGSRAAFVVALLLVAAWLLDGMWSAIPDAIVDASFLDAHATLRTVPLRLGELMITVGLIVSVVVTRARIGPALTNLAVASLASGRLLAWLGLADRVDDPPTWRIVLSMVTVEAYALGLVATAFAWALVALEPAQPPPFTRRGAAWGAIVAALALRAMMSPPRELERGAALIVFIAIFVVAAIAFARLASGGFGVPARIAMALCIVQVLAVIGGAVQFSHAGNEVIVSLLEMTMPFGFLAFAVTAAGAKGLPLPGLRIVVAGLLVLAAFGAFTTALATWLSLEGIMRIAKPFRALAVITRPAAIAALPLFALALAFIAHPPARPTTAA